MVAANLIQAEFGRISNPSRRRMVMNERIKELYDQCFVVLEHDTPNTGFDPNKFAELIVRECVNRGSVLATHYIEKHTEQEQTFLLAAVADYSTEIKKHFGVEE
jgi:hypothetical protein